MAQLTPLQEASAPTREEAETGCGGEKHQDREGEESPLETRALHTSTVQSRKVPRKARETTTPGVRE